MEDAPKYNNSTEPRDQRNLSGYGSGLGSVSYQPPDMGQTAQNEQSQDGGPSAQFNEPGVPSWQPTYMAPTTNMASLGAVDQAGQSKMAAIGTKLGPYKPLFVFAGIALAGAWVLKKMGGRYASADFSGEDYEGDED